MIEFVAESVPNRLETLYEHWGQSYSAWAHRPHDAYTSQPLSNVTVSH